MDQDRQNAVARCLLMLWVIYLQYVYRLLSKQLYSFKKSLLLCMHNISGAQTASSIGVYQVFKWVSDGYHMEVIEVQY